MFSSRRILTWPPIWICSSKQRRMSDTWKAHARIWTSLGANFIRPCQLRFRKLWKCDQDHDPTPTPILPAVALPSHFGFDMVRGTCSDRLSGREWRIWLALRPTDSIQQSWCHRRWRHRSDAWRRLRTSSTKFHPWRRKRLHLPNDHLR